MKLNQVIAVEKGVKTRTNADLSALYAVVQKSALFDGLKKTYSPLNEGGEQHPPQEQRVQQSVAGALKNAQKFMEELLDVTAQKDYTNCVAKADVSVDGETILTGVPVSYLLFLEKQITDLHSFVAKLPTLDPAREWKADAGLGLWRTEPTKSFRTKKEQRPIVLYGATDKHPAQTQLITEDINVGTWEEVRFSGATQATDVQKLLGRIEKLQKAVKFAREEANMTTVVNVTVADKVLGWIFKI